MKCVSVRSMLAVVLLLGIMQVVAYRFAGMSVSFDGEMPVPHPDALLYCQSARRIVEGHPFSYSAGEPASTGTTSVLYPFALAVPYACGAKGAALLSAGFWMNAVFYLVFLLGWSVAFARWTANGAVRLGSAVLLGLAVQPAVCAFGQSDTGFMMAVGALIAAGLAWNRTLLWGIALVLSPWVRPEGMMCTVGIGVALALRRVLPQFGVRAEKPRVEEWAFCMLAVLSCCGVFALNWWLTGFIQFSSVLNKGLFKLYPFDEACSRSFVSAVELLRIYFLGLDSASYRAQLVVPLVGGLAFILGCLSVRPREDGARWRMLCPLVMAGMLSFLTVATSGWQGTNYDRYLAWCSPVFVYFTACGAVSAVRRLPGCGRYLLPVAFVSYLVCAAGVTVCQFAGAARLVNRELVFSEDVNRVIPEGATIGSVHGGFAYQCGNHRLLHLSGLYSLGFLHPGRIDSAVSIEILRHDLSLRPDYWILSSPESFWGLSREQVEKIGRQVLVGPNGLELRKADWSLFDRSTDCFVPTGKCLVASVDVGHAADERRADYEIYDRWSRLGGRPFIHIGRWKGREIIDCGRVVVGGAMMTVALEPGKETVVRMRVLRRGSALFRDSFSGGCPLMEQDEVAFNLEVDGIACGKRTCPLPPLTKEKREELDKGAPCDFEDVSFTIPGDAIRATPCRVALYGDHIVCGYWFYQ